jgi:hypothetical protein
LRSKNNAKAGARTEEFWKSGINRGNGILPNPLNLKKENQCAGLNS